MTRSSCWLLGTSALAWFAALCACSGKGAPSGQGQTGGSACLGQAIGQTTSGACYACMQASCASQLGAFGSDCGDYLACVCPNGAYDVSAQSSQMCQAKLTSDSACLPSAQAVNSCAEQSCTSECHPSSTGSGGSSGGGGVAGAGGSGGGSGGGGGSAVMACGVTFSVASCAQCVTAQCCSVTQTCGEDQACVGIISCLHQCGQSTSCEQNCVSSAPASAQQELSAAAQCWSTSCSSGC